MSNSGQNRQNVRLEATTIQAGHKRQMKKTRTALIGAFSELVLEQRYPAIRIGDIIRRADVGRSTFYEHFRNKDDVLRQSLSGLLAVLADAVDESCDLRRLEFVIDHFQEQRRMALALLNGSASSKIVDMLASLIEERLQARCRDSGRSPPLPLELAAAQLAESQLGLVRAWLRRASACSAAVLASAMHKGAVACTQAICLSQR